MSGVRLEKLWLNRVTDPADAIVLMMLVDSQRGWPAKATAREYAGGRRRVVRTPRGDTRTWTPKLAPIPVALAEYLLDVAGQEFWARDVLGGKVVCFWDDAPHSGIGPIGVDGTQYVTPTLTLQQVTRTETARVMTL